MATNKELEKRVKEVEERISLHLGDGKAPKGPSREWLQKRIEELKERFELHLIPPTGKPARHEGDTESRIEKLEARDKEIGAHINLLVAAIRACGVDPGIPYAPPRNEEGYR